MCWVLEKVYENALLRELREAKLMVVRQHGIVGFCDVAIVGQYVLDLLVEDTIMVELKAVKVLDNTHNAQCINYLWTTGLPTLSVA